MRRTSTPADAEDVAAETFTIAWRKLDAIPSGEPLPWLYAVARRVLANHRRGLGRRERLAALLRVDDAATPMRAGEDRDRPAFAALGSLSPADQEILRLVAWEELGNQAVAAVLGITPNAAAIRLHRARARFAEALAGESTEDDLKYPDARRTSTDVKGTGGAEWKGAGE
jgi:RNA polymerase sigma-70 factor (ECF subfamily)